MPSEDIRIKAMPRALKSLHAVTVRRAELDGRPKWDKLADIVEVEQ